MKPAIAFLVLAAAAVGQVGPYPGGGYPPGTSRPGSSPGIPMPGSKKNKDKSKDTQEVLPEFRGTLKAMDSKSVSLELGDNRILEFKVTGKTKYYKNGDELKSPNFQPGDQIAVEAIEDFGKFLTAVNVYWEKAASSEKKADQPQDTVADTWATDSPKPPPAATASAPAPAKADPEDPGPPVLHRNPTGRRPAAAPPAKDEPAPPAAPEERVLTASEVERLEDAAPRPMPAAPGEDPLIRKAREQALEFTETLPNYLCQEMITRFLSEVKPANFQPLDLVTMEVVYENGKEDYRKINVNGKPKKSLEESGGAWSTGEFGTVLLDLLSPATAADFHYKRTSRTAGISARLYEFSVERTNSHWTVHAGSQIYVPAYTGAVWIDPSTARVLRIEMQARGLPQEFPLDHVESADDYDYVPLGGVRKFLLPVHAEVLSCQRDTARCSRNVIDFRNYHKFSGESTIEYGGVK